MFFYWLKICELKLCSFEISENVLAQVIKQKALFQERAIANEMHCFISINKF